MAKTNAKTPRFCRNVNKPLDNGLDSVTRFSLSVYFALGKILTLIGQLFHYIGEIFTVVNVPILKT